MGGDVSMDVNGNAEYRRRNELCIPGAVDAVIDPPKLFDSGLDHCFDLGFLSNVGCCG